jgi:U2 small nuclear ribonucleoprotein B''
LRGLFKSYGEVVDVVAHNNLRMRGQAFVSFESADVAKKALKEVKGFPLYSKPMVRIFFCIFISFRDVRVQQISFARIRSDAVVKRLDAEHYEEHRQRRLQHKSVYFASLSHHIMLTRIPSLSRNYPLHQSPKTEVSCSASGCREWAPLFYCNLPCIHSIVFEIIADGPAVSAPRRPAVQMPDEYLPPNKILFLQNLPESVSKDQLMALFSQ